MSYTIVHNDYLKRYRDFFLSLQTSDRVLIIHDCDADGIGSGMLVGKFLESRGVPVVGYMSTTIRSALFSEHNYSIAKEKKPTVIICTDMDALSLPGFQTWLENRTWKFFVQDHHHFNKEYEHIDTIVYMHPQLVSDCDHPYEYCSSKFVYDVLQTIQVNEQWKYLAVFGILGDGVSAQWKEFLHDISATHALRSFRPIMHAIFASSAVSEDEYQQLVDCLVKTNSFEDALSCVDKEQYHHVQEELEYYSTHYKEYTQYDSKSGLYVVTINAKFHIASVLSTILSEQDPDGIWLVLHELGTHMRLHARNKTKRVNLALVMKHACERFGGTGGGHIVAAGGKILKEDTLACIAYIKETLPFVTAGDLH